MWEDVDKWVYVRSKNIATCGGKREQINKTKKVVWINAHKGKILKDRNERER